MATTNGTQLATTEPRRQSLAAGNHGLVLRSIEEMWRFAEAVARSGIAPRGLAKPEQILVALQYGAELGLKPMQALATVMVVNGRATLWGDGMLAVAQASGLLEDIKEAIDGSPEKLEAMAAVCEVKRRGRPTPVRVAFGWRDAKLAGLTGKDTYKQHPGRMLKARARAFALRDAFPDVLCGIISTDEAHDLPDVESAPVFADGATQAPTDLDELIAGDGEIISIVDVEAIAADAVDDGAPTDDDLKRDGLFN